jgi:hypothetical protein
MNQRHTVPVAQIAPVVEQLLKVIKRARKSNIYDTFLLGDEASFTAIEQATQFVEEAKAPAPAVVVQDRTHNTIELAQKDPEYFDHRVSLFQIKKLFPWISDTLSQLFGVPVQVVFTNTEGLDTVNPLGQWVYLRVVVGGEQNGVQKEVWHRIEGTSVSGEKQ